MALAAMPTGRPADAEALGLVVAWIAVDPQPGRIRFEPMAWSSGRESLAFRFEIARLGSGGRSVSRQGGAAVLTPGLPTTLATVSLSLSGGDSFTADLVVSPEGGQAIAVSIATPPATRS